MNKNVILLHCQEANAFLSVYGTKMFRISCFRLCLHLNVFEFGAKYNQWAKSGFWSVTVTHCITRAHHRRWDGCLASVAVRAELKCNSCGPVVGIHCELHQAILLAQITSAAPAPLRFKPSTASSPGPLNSQAAVWLAAGQTTLKEGGSS